MAIHAISLLPEIVSASAAYPGAIHDTMCMYMSLTHFSFGTPCLQCLDKINREKYLNNSAGLYGQLHLFLALAYSCSTLNAESSF
ncbi:hypothetical protein V8C42DRAFT_314715 [Trichoderma barbatum]